MSAYLPCCVLAATALAGCAAPADPPAAGRSTAPVATPPPAQAAARSAEAVYTAVLREFDRGDYYKPIIDDETALYAQLAPLIVQEVTTDGDSPGTVRPATGSEPTVFYEEAEIELHGRPHTQMRYAWFDAGRAPQQLIMTLSTDGRPIIWEMPAGDWHVVFVARSIEDTASRQVGERLPGRNFVTEPERATHPDLIVARILADGPMVMGPWVYLAADPPRVTTVLCRCMAAQVDLFRETIPYRLAPVTAMRGAGEWNGWTTRVDDLRLPPRL